MKFYQNWLGSAINSGEYSDYFKVQVPGNIQKDYSEYMGWGDVNWMNTCKKFEDTEDWFWSYKTDISVDAKENERVFFVTEGIEYEYDVKLNGKLILHHIGMFSPKNLNLATSLK